MVNKKHSNEDIAVGSDIFYCFSLSQLTHC